MHTRRAVANTAACTNEAKNVPRVSKGCVSLSYWGRYWGRDERGQPHTTVSSKAEAPMNSMNCLWDWVAKGKPFDAMSAVDQWIPAGTRPKSL